MAQPYHVKPSADAGAVAARKANLLRDGERYRLAIVQAKRDIRYGVQPEAMLHGAMDFALGAVRAPFDALPVILPAAGGALRLLGRSRWSKGAIAGTVAASLIALFFLRRRDAREQAQSP